MRCSDAVCTGLAKSAPSVWAVLYHTVSTHSLPARLLVTAGQRNLQGKLRPEKVLEVAPQTKERLELSPGHLSFQGASSSHLCLTSLSSHLLDLPPEGYGDSALGKHPCYQSLRLSSVLGAHQVVGRTDLLKLSSDSSAFLGSPTTTDTKKLVKLGGGSTWISVSSRSA